ncbi:hypothetical protein [Paenibacillus humicus]|uniref:hypothetical protein n=1 Tax=Paenibacillus humicus TaxID=412861 RepID=UPI003D28B4B5
MPIMEGNCLFFRRSITSSTPEPILIGDNNIGDGYAVTIDEKFPVIQIDFNSYVGYSVLNESFTVWDDYEEFEGRAFRIYSKSRYLDFIGAGTIASEEYPGPFKHYGVSCLNHIVNIVSTEKPVVMEVSREKLRNC